MFIAEINLSIEVSPICSEMQSSFDVNVCVHKMLGVYQRVTPADHKFVFSINFVCNLFHVSACLQTSSVVRNAKELVTDVPEGMITAD